MRETINSNKGKTPAVRDSGHVRRLGVHASIAGGVHLSLERARELGCNTVQIFSHNPRAWVIGRTEEKVVAEFKRLRNLYDIRPVFIHTSYLINLASSRHDLREKSMRMLSQEMDIADELGAEYVVLHTGSASDATADAGRAMAIDSLQKVLKAKRWSARLLLENTAGERGDISSGIKDLKELIEGTGSAMIGGICFDTCHAFQAGYDLSDEEGIDAAFKEIKEHIGLDRVKLIHLNDSKKAFNSGVDRHEHIGKGSIGLKGLERFLNHQSLRHIPLILETPKKSEEDDPMNLKTVRGLLKD